jgi:co-chaperonin GroES (HSP10)
MSNVGVHDFSIPHEHVRPTRDMVTIRLPLPPKMVGSLQIPETFREMAKHNIMVGRIVAMGPLAFVYKDANGDLTKQAVALGDWVTFRPYAGTQVMSGQVVGAGGSWRYISSFQDVIGIIPADKMPDPASLNWDDGDGSKTAAPALKPENFGGTPRETIKGK